jgi:hypothetical protein
MMIVKMFTIKYKLPIHTTKMLIRMKPFFKLKCDAQDRIQIIFEVLPIQQVPLSIVCTICACKQLL